MTTLPSESAISYIAGEAAGPWVAAVAQLWAFVAESAGAQVADSLTIASGSVTPTRSAHTVDTEGSASTDDLTTVATTNLADGRWLLLRPVSAARVVTVKHQAGGAGQVSLAYGADYVMTSLSHMLLLERVGADWREIARYIAAGTSTAPGLLQLASNAEAQAGTDTAKALTAAAGAAAYPRLGTVSSHTKAQYFAETALTDGATINWDMDSNQCARVTLGGNRTLANPSNMRAGATYLLRVVQDATGSRTLAFGTDYLFPGGADPTMSTAANAVDLLTFYCTGTKMLGSISKGFA